MGGDGGGEVFSPEPDEIDGFDGCHMLEHHLQAGKALDHRPKGLGDEHRLAIEDVDVWVRGFAVDQQGQVIVADRENSRIQIFDQEGNFIAYWNQFGRPSGVFIDSKDIIYVADSESNSRSNPGYKRGIRIASAKDGFVLAFIPDPEANPDEAGTSGAEGVAVDSQGNIYGAEVGPEDLKKYVKQQ